MARTAAKTADATKGKTVETVTRTREVVEQPSGELDLTGDPGGLEDSDPLAKLDEIGVDGSAKYLVHRTSPSGFDGYVGTYTRDELSPDRIYEEWGGGRFRITVRDGKGAIRGNAILMVAGKPKHKADAVTTPAPVAPQMGGELARVLESIHASQAASQKATDGQLTLLTTLLTTLITKEPPKAPPAPDPLAMLEKAASILRPRGDSGADQVKMLMAGIDLANKLGGGGHEPSMADLLLKGFDTIKEAAALAPAAQPRLVSRRAPPPGTVAAGEATPPNQPEKPVITDAMKQMAWLKQQAAFLIHQAKKTPPGDPELYAELFLDNLPEFLPLEKIAEQMQDPGAVAKLAMVIPQVAAHQEWFEKFRVAIVGFLEQVQEPGGGVSGGGVVIDHDAAGDDNAGGGGE